MFIKKVKIHNYRCYKDFTISLEQKMNIVVGDNEASKSAIAFSPATAFSFVIHTLNNDTKLIISVL